MEIGCEIMSQIDSTVSSHLAIISVSIFIHHYIYICLYMWLSGVGKIPWRRKWQPTPAFLPGEFHGQRSLESPWDCKESNLTVATEHKGTRTCDESCRFTVRFYGFSYKHFVEIVDFFFFLIIVCPFELS